MGAPASQQRAESRGDATLLAHGLGCRDGQHFLCPHHAGRPILRRASQDNGLVLPLATPPNGVVLLFPGNDTDRSTGTYDDDDDDEEGYCEGDGFA